MPEQVIPPPERIGSSLKRLVTATSDQKAAASELGKSIAVLDDALRKINLQISAWHTIATSKTGQSTRTRDVGWTRLKGQWCIAIRQTHNDEAVHKYDEDIWRFIDAPAWMVNESVSKLADLFDTLVKRTQEVTEKFRARKLEAEKLAGAVTKALAEVTAAQKGKK